VLKNFELPDFGDFLNSLNHGAPIGTGVVDMALTWSGGARSATSAMKRTASPAAR
jgi:hypothetical protein